uniref:NADH-ubiquinone oxidoreductase chain 4 n=1 Tax=Pinctada imbricata TaxID=66713 RepID=A0A343B6L5_PINIB|nr:NADH dehydrogenase subunit 4 [Pinctada imbricata]
MFISVFLWPSSYLMLWSICLGLVLSVGGKSWEVDMHYEALGSTWDGMSCSLISFHYWLMAVVLISGWGYGLKAHKLGRHFWCCLWGLTVSVQMALSANFFLCFFVFFEASLLPVGVMILLWGSQPERTKAFEYMVVYSLCSGGPFFVGVEYVGMLSPSWFHGVKESVQWSHWLVGGMLLGGLAKLPMFGFHIWLPKAHVEASLEGSLVLAGILLKLGGVQVYRVLVELKGGFSSVLVGFVLLGVWGGVYTSLMCFRQPDVKSVIAYSSVGHMSVVLSSLLVGDLSSLGVSLSMMIGHGFVSCGMFSLAGVSAEASGSRSLYVLKGLGCVYPVMSLFWFVGCGLNMGLPPTLGFSSEIGVLGQLWGYGFSSLLGVLSGVFLSAAYNFFIYSETQHGLHYSGSSFLVRLSVRDMLGFSLCLLPGAMAFFFLPFFFSVLYGSGMATGSVGKPKSPPSWGGWEMGGSYKEGWEELSEWSLARFEG